MKNRNPAEKHSAGFWFVQMNPQIFVPAEVVPLSRPEENPQLTIAPAITCFEAKNPTVSDTVKIKSGNRRFRHL